MNKGQTLEVGGVLNSSRTKQVKSILWTLMSKKMSEVYIPVPFLVAPDKCRMVRLATTEREIRIRYHSVIVSAIKSIVNLYLRRIQNK